MVRIDVRAICPTQKMFDPEKQRGFREAVGRSSGKVIGVIHPLFLRDRLSDPKQLELVIDNYFLIKKISSSGYFEYLQRLEHLLSTTTMPVFIFAEEGMREVTEKWLENLPLISPTLYLDTESGDPKPKLDGVDQP